VGSLSGAGRQVLALPALYFLIQRLTGNLDVTGPARDLTDRVHGAAFVLVAVVVTFLAPVVEELFYRGLMLRAAARCFGTRWAVVGTSAIFGASHFQDRAAGRQHRRPRGVQRGRRRRPDDGPMSGDGHDHGSLAAVGGAGREGRLKAVLALNVVVVAAQVVFGLIAHSLGLGEQRRSPQPGRRGSRR